MTVFRHFQWINAEHQGFWQKMWRYCENIQPPSVETFHCRGAKIINPEFKKHRNPDYRFFCRAIRFSILVARWFTRIFGLSHSTAGVTLQWFQIDGYLRIFRTSVDADSSVKGTRVRKEPVYFCSQLHDILGGMTRCPVPSVSRLFFFCLSDSGLFIYLWTAYGCMPFNRVIHQPKYDDGKPLRPVILCLLLVLL